MPLPICINHPNRIPHAPRGHPVKVSLVGNRYFFMNRWQPTWIRCKRERPLVFIINGLCVALRTAASFHSPAFAAGRPEFPWFGGARQDVATEAAIDFYRCVDRRIVVAKTARKIMLDRWGRLARDRICDVVIHATTLAIGPNQAMVCDISRPIAVGIIPTGRRGLNQNTAGFFCRPLHHNAGHVLRRVVVLFRI